MWNSVTKTAKLHVLKGAFGNVALSRSTVYELWMFQQWSKVAGQPSRKPPIQSINRSKNQYSHCEYGHVVCLWKINSSTSHGWIKNWMNIAQTLCNVQKRISTNEVQQAMRCGSMCTLPKRSTSLHNANQNHPPKLKNMTKHTEMEKMLSVFNYWGLVQ